MLGAVIELRSWKKRYRTLREHARETIEAEGGAVEAMTKIGMLLRSPFPAVNICAMYLKIRCSYANDAGVWYVCGAKNGVHWVWSSSNGKMNPPTERDYEVKVDNNVLVLPRWLSVVLYITLFGFIFGGPAAYLRFIWQPAPADAADRAADLRRKPNRDI